MNASGRVVYVNGEFVPEKDARISIYDSALMFGDMVFEMIRTFEKTPFKLREHLDRLYGSIKGARIPLTMDIVEMERAVHETLEVNLPTFAPDDECRIMIDVSRGVLPGYAKAEGAVKGPYVVIGAVPLRWSVAGLGAAFDSGVNSVVTAQRAIPAQLMDPKVKSRSRLYYALAKLEAADRKGERNRALLLDPDGFIAEGVGDNFLIVKGATIVSPEGRNILRGISRAYVLYELGPQLGIARVEKNIDPYDVREADEAFVTSTPFCILPVTSLDGRPIGNGKTGPITQSLLAAWSKNVGVDIPGQIKGWDNAGS